MSRFALELPNGEFYFIEKMWERTSEAGFRFSAPIDIDAFVSEASPFAKRQVRLRTNLPATMPVGQAECPIVICDLSQEGARLESDAPLAVFQSLRIEAERIAAPILATVQWKAKRQYGVLFQRPFSLAELAHLAWSLHEPGSVRTGRPMQFAVVRNAPPCEA